MHFDSAMEPHCLSVFFSLNLMLIVAHGALPPELYWKMMLPTTPVPKAITELLSLGGDVVSRGKSADSETQSQNLFRLFDGTKGIPPQEIRPFWFNGATETQLRYGDTSIGRYKNLASDHHLHKKTKSGLFFLEENLHPGNKLNVHFSNRNLAVPILPREIAEQIPFSLEKLAQALEILSVKPESKNAEIVEKTIAECEARTLEEEEQFCATSLESVVDFIASKLGKDVLALSTEVDFGKETKLQSLLVKDGVKKLADDDVAACHSMTYPYAVFLCHKLEKTSAYYVPLEGEEDGVRVKAVAVCHRDTSEWNPNHVAFQELNVKPGMVPVCHVLPERHLLWVPK